MSDDSPLRATKVATSILKIQTSAFLLLLESESNTPIKGSMSSLILKIQT